MKKILLALLVVGSLLVAGCREYEEIEFDGVVVGIRNCSSAILDDGAGLVVKLSKPEGYGGTLTSTDGQTMENVMVLYEPGMIIRVQEHIWGTFYVDDKYSRANCNIRWDLDLPEGIINKLDVED